MLWKASTAPIGSYELPVGHDDIAALSPLALTRNVPAIVVDALT